MYVLNMFAFTGAWKQSWRALEAAYNQGLARAIGVSNFDRALLQELWDWAEVKPHVVQNWFDPFHQGRFHMCPSPHLYNTQVVFLVQNV
jgi:diketogulonate reductase-like aldo/keto reductase